MSVPHRTEVGRKIDFRAAVPLDRHASLSLSLSLSCAPPRLAAIVYLSLTNSNFPLDSRAHSRIRATDRRNRSGLRKNVPRVRNASARRGGNFATRRDSTGPNKAVRGRGKRKTRDARVDSFLKIVCTGNAARGVAPCGYNGRRKDGNRKREREEKRERSSGYYEGVRDFSKIPRTPTNRDTRAYARAIRRRSRASERKRERREETEPLRARARLPMSRFDIRNVTYAYAYTYRYTSYAYTYMRERS